jgi:hypothetical protein
MIIEKIDKITREEKFLSTVFLLTKKLGKRKLFFLTIKMPEKTQDVQRGRNKVRFTQKN